MRKVIREQNDVIIYLKYEEIEQAIEKFIDRIRPQSKKFYTEELIHDLTVVGESLIDKHAGMGIFYKLIVEDFRK